VRTPLATSIQSEDGTLAKGGRVQNGLVEAIGEFSVVRKRPGLAIGSLIRVGVAQLLYWWSGVLNSVIGDIFNQGAAPTSYPLATLNPSDKAATITLSGNNLTASVLTSGSVRATQGITTGQWYFEAKFTALSNINDVICVGVANSSFDLTNYAFQSPDAIGYQLRTSFNDSRINYNSTFLASGSVFASGTTIAGLLIDADARTIKFYRDGVLVYTASGSNVPTGALFPTLSISATGIASTMVINFGATAFSYTPALTSANLSPTNAGLQFTAQDSGSNAASSLLMIKNASQAWTVTPAGVVTQITDVDYPGTYTVTATSLTRIGTVATVTLPIDANFQVGSTVTIAGATPSAYNGAQTVTGVTPSSSAPSKRVQVNITRSGTTATATTVSEPHSFKTGDVVPITGAAQSEYNGSFTVTYISATQFSFTVTTTNTTTTGTATESIASPATGTPVITDLNRYYVSGLINTVGTPTTVHGVSLTIMQVGMVFTFINDFDGWVLRNLGSLGPFTVATASGNNFTFTAAGAVFPFSNSYTYGYFPGLGQILVEGEFTLAAVVVSSITSSNGVATVTTSSSHYYSAGKTITISGALPYQYNGSFPITVTSATTFTYEIPLAQTTTSTSTSPATPATGTIFAGTPGSATGYSFTFTIAGSPTTPATGTITASGGRNTVPGIAYLNGYFCVMDVNGVIYNSAEDNPASWTALEYVTAQAENGAGKAIAKSLNYLVAFKEWSTEFFYDAKNEPPGSPFSPVDNGFTQVGCASGDSLAEVDGALMWIAQVRQRGRSVYVMRGTDQQKVSTPDIERILNLSTLASVFAYGLKVDGHTLYVLTLVDLNVTLVYDAQSGTWVQWSTLTAAASVNVSSITRVGTTATVTTGTAHGLSDGDPVTIAGASQSDYNGTFQISYVSTTVFTIEVANSPVTPATGTITAVPYTESYFKLTKYANAGGTNTFLHESNGYTSTMSSSVYQDNSAPINFTMRTARLDGGSLNRKQLGQLCLVGETTGDTVMIRFSDDDYTTNSIYRRLSIATERPALRRLGAFRRRSFEVKHTGNTNPRLEAMEIGQ
jgi:hypothetical protein